jgi:hypothetical protein
MRLVYNIPCESGEEGHMHTYAYLDWEREISSLACET